MYENPPGATHRYAVVTRHAGGIAETHTNSIEYAKELVNGYALVVPSELSGGAAAYYDALYKAWRVGGGEVRPGDVVALAMYPYRDNIAFYRVVVSRDEANPFVLQRDVRGVWTTLASYPSAIAALGAAGKS
jgi:hypothetical protein